MKIAYLFDSGSNYEIKFENDCFVVPMVINIKENEKESTYFDNEQISREKLEQLIDSNTPITTSQPVIGHLIETIDSIYKSYDVIIAIPFASALSSTYNCILNLQREYGKDKFLIANIDAMGITGNWFLQEVKEYVQTHATINQEEIDKLSNSFKANVCGSVIVTDTKRLILGGRLKGLKGLIAKTLKLKLIIKYKHNLEFKDKSLHLKDAIDKTLDIIDEDCEFRKYGIKRCSILPNLCSQEDNEKFYQYIIEKLNTKAYISKSLLPGCVICHTGCDTISILIESNR